MFDDGMSESPAPEGLDGFDGLDGHGGLDRGIGQLTEEAVDQLSDADLEALYDMLEAAAGSDRRGAVPDLSDLGIPLAVAGFLADQLTAGSGASMADRVRLIQVQARLVAHHQARLLDSMVGLADDYERLDLAEHGRDADMGLSFEGAVAEIRCALSLTRRAAETDLELAWMLRDRLPAVWEALHDGKLDLRRAQAIAYGTGHVDPDAAREVAARVLQQVEGLTAGQVRALVRRLCVESDPDDAKARYEQATDQRRVTAELGVDGTGTIIASDLAAEQVAFVMSRIDAIARDLNRNDETRGIDQLRADVFVDLLAGHQSSRKAVIDVTVDVATLAGLADRAGELGGMGPIVADITRDMATTYGSQWRYAVVHPETGYVVVAGSTKRRPSAAVRRTVELRDRTCVFPGCRQPARRSDLDHTTPYSQRARTDAESLAACCRHDHVIRHQFKWSYTHNPDGSYTWTAPSGNNYTRPPPPW